MAALRCGRPLRFLIRIWPDGVPGDDLDKATLELAQDLATKPPAAIRLGLTAYHRQEALDFEDALIFLQEQLMTVLSTEDAQEGIMAFLQKRQPSWSGR